MKILTVANRKGGAGKSTCAAHLAIEAVKSSLKVLLIDMDPQKTLEGWWSKRQVNDLQLIDLIDNNLETTINMLRNENFDLCIIDTPGDASQYAREGIKVADLVLIPSKPTAPDLTAIGRTISMMEEQNKQFVFVLTQGIVRSKANFEASSVLSTFGPVAPAIICNRIAYSSAMGIGGSAGDIDKTSIDEIAQVWNFVKERLFEYKKIKKLKLNILENNDSKK